MNTALGNFSRRRSLVHAWIRANHVHYAINARGLIGVTYYYSAQHASMSPTALRNANGPIGKAIRNLASVQIRRSSLMHYFFKWLLFELACLFDTELVCEKNR